MAAITLTIRASDLRTLAHAAETSLGSSGALSAGISSALLASRMPFACSKASLSLRSASSTGDLIGAAIKGHSALGGKANGARVLDETHGWRMACVVL